MVCTKGDWFFSPGNRMRQRSDYIVCFVTFTCSWHLCLPNLYLDMNVLRHLSITQDLNATYCAACSRIQLIPDTVTNLTKSKGSHAAPRAVAGCGVSKVHDVAADCISSPAGSDSQEQQLVPDYLQQSCRGIGTTTSFAPSSTPFMPFSAPPPPELPAPMVQLPVSSSIQPLPAVIVACMHQQGVRVQDWCLSG